MEGGSGGDGGGAVRWTDPDDSVPGLRSARSKGAVATDAGTRAAGRRDVHGSSRYLGIVAPSQGTGVVAPPSRRDVGPSRCEVRTSAARPSQGCRVGRVGNRPCANIWRPSALRGRADARENDRVRTSGGPDLGAPGRASRDPRCANICRAGPGAGAAGFGEVEAPFGSFHLFIQHGSDKDLRSARGPGIGARLPQVRRALPPAPARLLPRAAHLRLLR